MSMASVEESFPRGGSQKKPKETGARKRPVDRDNLFHTFEEEDVTKKRKKGKGDHEKSDQLKPKNTTTEGSETSTAKHGKPIEILKFKSLTPGLLLLGCVKDATDFELIISLPHGLTGFVQVTNICEAYTKLLSEQVETEELSPNLAPLQQLFSPGMLLRCSVSSLEETKGGFHSVKLSLNPKDVNRALSPGALKPGMLLSGCVSSVEDHGYLIDIGVGGSKAFLPRQKAQSYIKQSKKGGELKIGQYLNCLIDEVKDAGRIARLSVNHSDIMGALATEEQQWTQNTLLPGLVVKGKVQKVFPDGIQISFLSNLTGTVDFMHLDPKRCDGYKDEQSVKACVIYVDPTAKAIGLSMRQLFLQPGNPLKQLSSERIGEVVNHCQVITFHDHSGAVFDLGDGNLAFAHIHNIPSQALAYDKFKKGIKRTVRIVDYSPMDEMALMSLKTSVIQTPYFSYQDIQPGQLIEGTVASLRDCGIIVQITRHMTGLVPSLHLADVRIKQPEKKYSVGQLVKCRVLTICPAERKLILTLKKTLVESKLPIISSFNDAKPGMTTVGFISRVKDFGCLVQFYNDMRGLVPRNELSMEPVTNPEEVFYEGQVVKVMVLSTDPNKERIKLSFKLTMGPLSQSTELSPLEKERALKCEIGKVFDVKVVKKSDTGLVVSILQEEVTAFLPMIHLSDHVTNCRLLWNNLQEGDIIPRVMCLNNANGQITLCRKQSLMSTFEDGGIVKEFSDIHSGMMLTGWVKSIMSYGVFVQFPHGLFGLAPKSAMCDKFVTNTEDHFVLGQTVIAKVTNTDEEKKRVLLSLKLSECTSDDTTSESFALLNQCFQELLFLRNILSNRDDSKGTKESQSLAKLLLGQTLKLTVKDVNDNGSAHFSGGETTVGMTVSASSFHVGDVTLVPGQKATAMVLYVDSLQSNIHVSLRPELLKIKVKKLRINDTVSSVVQHVAGEFAVVSLVETGQLAAIPVASHYNDTYRFDSEKLTVGQTIRVIIKTLTTSEHGVLLAVQGPLASRTNKKMLKKSDGQRESSSSVKHSLSFGDVVTGTVKSIKPTSVLVTITDKLVGFIHASQIFDDTPGGIFPTSKLKVKQRVEAKVIGGRDVKTHRFLPISHPHFTQSIPELSIRPSVFKSDFSKTSASAEDHLVDRLNSYKPEQSVTCFVWKYNTIAKSLDVEISPEIRGRIDHMLLSVSPKILKHPEKHFKLGQSLTATVIRVDTTKMRLHLSLIGTHSLEKGTVLLGTVRKVDPRTGLTIALPFGKIGNASLVDLSDFYSEAPLDNFSVGKAIRCCVLSTNDHRIRLSLRQSRVNPKGTGKVEDCEITCIEDITEGQLLRGYVTSVCDQGVFVSLSATIAGRVQFQHTSKFFVGQHSVYEKHLPVGRLLTAKALSVDSSNDHVELSLLPNDTAKPDVIPDSLGLPLRVANKEKKKKKELGKLKEKRKRALSESDQAPVSKKKKSRVSKEEKDSSIEVYFREEEEEEPVEKKSKPKTHAFNAAPRLQTSSSFTWDVNLNTLKVAQEQKGDEESSDSDEDEGQQSKIKKKTKKDKETEKKQAEKELSKIETSLMDSTRQPQTADDFDRLVLGSPNSSILWLQYMAFHLHATEIEKARAIAERALKTISFREEQEKLNVWVAFLNLENLYGTEDSLMKVFERAVQYNEPLKVFMQLGDIYAKSDKFKQAEDLYKTMLKRFRKEKCVWVKYATYLLKQGQMEEAHRLLQRALKCLPDKEHVDVISKFAQLEFHLGDVERAKSIFESTLSNYPKRTDLWSVYIDMMIKHGSQKKVRKIFERVIHLSLAAKRMKFFFKRYLDYEKKHGSQESVQAVKEKALEYVESKRSLSES